MDGATLSMKVFAGYGKAARRVGFDVSHYRPNGTSNPLAAGNRLADIKANFTIHDSKNFNFEKPSDYKSPLFHGLFDASATLAGDYLVSDELGTYFIASVTPAMPPLCVKCNRTINLLSSQTGGQPPPLGQSGYQPNISTTSTALMTGWPVSILKRRSYSDNYLPSDLGAGDFEMLCPSVSGVEFKPSMIVVDEVGNRHGTLAIEKTDLGWRVDIRQVKT